MKDAIQGNHGFDDRGNPTGGSTSGLGVDIRWQKGPIVQDGKTHSPNGACVEAVIAAAIDRLKFFQEASDGAFACEENARAIRSLHAAIDHLEVRFRRREAQGVAGTHKRELPEAA